MSVFFLSCGGTPTEDAGTPTTPIAAGNLSNPSGKIETAFCKKGTVVWATSVDASWTQTGALSGEVKTNDGLYVVRGNFSGPFISFLVPQGTCFNEYLGTYTDNVILRGMEQVTATAHNKNYATSLEFYIAEDHFFDPGSSGYESLPTSFTMAKSEILDYFAFPSMSKGFNELSVVGDTVSDAYLLAFEIYITAAGDGANQYNRLAELGLAILNNDLTYRSQVRSFVQSVKVKQITDNIRNERVNLGFPDEVAPLWLLPFYPDYYEELMVTRPNPNVLEQVDNPGTNYVFELTGYTLYAIPKRFTNSEAARYYADNLPGTKSIWTRSGADEPGTKVIDMETLREPLIDPAMTYNGYMGESTGITNGTDYFLVVEYDGQLTKKGSGALPFGKCLASNDGGLTWVGHGNASTWFSTSGESYFTTD